MLLLHEVHEVDGRHELDFERAYRDEWAPLLAEREDSRLLYYLNHAVGTGASYRVVTYCALRDGAAWQALAERVQGGDLKDASGQLDELRHEVTGKLLVPLPWSPLQEIDWSAPPGFGDHPLSIFMEDTVWPYEGRLDEYIAAAGEHYAKEIEERNENEGAMIEIQGAFRTAFGTGRRREIVLWQQVRSKRALAGLIGAEVPARYKRPGLWLHDALSLRDQWESRLLRTSAWSPMY